MRRLRFLFAPVESGKSKLAVQRGSSAKQSTVTRQPRETIDLLWSTLTSQGKHTFTRPYPALILASIFMAPHGPLEAESNVCTLLSGRGIADM